LLVAVDDDALVPVPVKDILLDMPWDVIPTQSSLVVVVVVVLLDSVVVLVPLAVPDPAHPLAAVLVHASTVVVVT
jgi:hypothetical protein